MEMNIRKGTPNDAILVSKILNLLLSERYVQIPTHRELINGITGVHRNLDPFIAGMRLLNHPVLGRTMLLL